MAKGASIKFRSYKESVPKLLSLLKLQNEIKKYDKIILKPHISSESSTPAEFAEVVLRFCLENKNPVADVLIAEGSENSNTMELLESLGYQKLAERYGIGLIDLNNSEIVEVESEKFIKFSTIKFPQILENSFLISIPKLSENEETDIVGSLSTMLGAFPSAHYSGFFSQSKSKIRKWPVKYSIHDIIMCKTPDFSIIDASEQGMILAGLPLEIDKQSAKLLGKDWQEVPHLKLLDETSHHNSKLY